MGFKHLQKSKRMRHADLIEARRDAMAQATDQFLNGSAYPDEVYRVLEQHGLRHGVLVDDRSPPQSCCGGVYGGLILTTDQRFIAFEVDTGRCQGDAPHASVLDVTSSTNADRRVRGIGTSDGFLAKELLARLRREGRLGQKDAPEPGAG
jgi:hypothetical protein